MKLQAALGGILVCGLLPAFALAETQVGVTTAVRADVRTTSSANVSASGTPGAAESADVQWEETSDASATATAKSDVAKSGMLAQAIAVDLKAEGTPAISLVDLKARIEAHRAQVEAEAASSTAMEREAFKNANPVRIAVHAFLESRALLGGIGAQVSEIAKGMNDSLATTTVLEVQLKSRGFLARLFFGGDKGAAQRLEAQVNENQERINALKDLLAGAAISAELKTILEVHIEALEEAQVRLKALADKEGGSWGLFSWRFGSK